MDWTGNKFQITQSIELNISISQKLHTTKKVIETMHLLVNNNNLKAYPKEEVEDAVHEFRRL